MEINKKYLVVAMIFLLIIVVIISSRYSNTRYPEVENINDSENMGNVLDSSSSMDIDIYSKSDEKSEATQELVKVTIDREIFSDDYIGETLEFFLKEREWLENFREAAVLLNIDLTENISSIKEKYNNQICRNVIEIMVGDRISGDAVKLKISRESGELLFFFKYGNRYPEGIPEEQLVSKETALASVLEFQKRMGLEGDSENPHIGKGPQYWEIRLNRYYKGFVCAERNIRMRVSIADGYIQYFIDKAPILPELIVENIDEKTAKAKAMSFLTDLIGKDQQNISLWHVNQTIGLTTGSWNIDSPHPLIPNSGAAPIPRLVWHVSYKTTEHDAFFLYIDSETGEVLKPYLGM